MARRTKSPDAATANAFEEPSFYLGRAYYDHIKVIEQLLAERGLDDRIGSGMGQILFRLFEKDDCIIQDLSRSLRLSPSRLTTMLGRMEEAGLIRRQPDPVDGRAIRVSLTRAGRALEPACWEVLRDVNRILTRGFTPAEIDSLKRALGRMVDNLAAYRAESPLPLQESDEPPKRRRS